MEPFEPPTEESARESATGVIAQVFLGIGTVVFTDAIALMASAISDATFGLLLMGMGAVQFVWLTPIAVYYTRQGMRLAAQVTMVVAAIVFLLYAACYGLLFSSGF